MHSQFSGLIAAPYTPFTSSGELNIEVIPNYVRLLRNNGVSAAFIGGTTGEFASLTIEERLRLTKAWTRAAGQTFRVIVHVGHTVLSEAQLLADHAQRSGAAAIACMAPGFFRPQSIHALVNWCAFVAAAAPALPFYYYHMPSMNGVDLRASLFLAEAANRIPNFAGIKYSHEDLDEFASCVQIAGERFEMLMGRDELLLDGLRRGASGAVGSTYNYAAPLYQRIIDALHAGDADKAQELQGMAVGMIAICSALEVGHLPASKTLMRSFGVECGPSRLPLENPTAEQAARLQAQLKSTGFSGYSARALVDTAEGGLD